MVSFSRPGVYELAISVDSVMFLFVVLVVLVVKCLKIKIQTQNPAHKKLFFLKKGQIDRKTTQKSTRSMLIESGESKILVKH